MRRAVKSAFAAVGGLTRVKCDLQKAARRFGFAAGDGALAHGKGLRIYEGSAGKYVLPPQCAPEKLYFLRGTQCFCAAAYAQGKMYVCLSDGGAFAETEIAFAKVPSSVRVYDGGEALVLSDGAAVCLFSSDGLHACADIPPFDCAGYAYERLWVYRNEGGVHRVRFSALTDIHSFGDGGGYIDLPDGRGEVLAFADLDNAFYLFRKFGIQKLSAAGTEDEFALSDAAAPLSEICKDTVCTENGRAYFLCGQGLFSFDGRSAQPLYPEVPSAADGAACAAACGGKVYAAAEFFGEKCAGIFREDGEGWVLLPGRGKALAAALTPGGAKALCVSEGEICEIAGSGRPALWESGACEPFGGETCVLEEIAMTADGLFTVEARSEYGRRRFEISAAGGAKRVRTALRGARFAFTVLSLGEKGRIESFAAGYSRPAE